LNVFSRYCNYFLLSMSWDEFELNRMNVYVLYDVISMFVSDMVCDRDIIFRKGYTRIMIVRMCIVCEFV